MQKEMPEIKPGMVIEYSDDLAERNIGIVCKVLGDAVACYEINENPDRELYIVGADVVYNDVINAIYSKASAGSPIFCSHELYDIFLGNEREQRIWQRQDVREMTVREIEAELGYKIKVIGEEKR